MSDWRSNAKPPVFKDNGLDEVCNALDDALLNCQAATKTNAECDCWRCKCQRAEKQRDALAKALAAVLPQLERVAGQRHTRAMFTIHHKTKYNYNCNYQK